MILHPPQRGARRMYVRLYLDAARPARRCPWCRSSRGPCTDPVICDEARHKRLEDV